MADTEQYLLTFDLSEITRNISDLQSAYESMSTVISKSADDANKQLDNIQRKADNVSAKLTASFQALDTFSTGIIAKLDKISSGFDSINKNAKSITKNLKKLEGLDLSKAAKGKSTAAERIAAVAPGADLGAIGGGDAASAAKAAQKAANKASADAAKAVKDVEKASEEILTIGERLKKTLIKEGTGAKKAMLGLADKAGLGGLTSVLKGGGLIGSLIGLMVMGTQTKQRIGAERGEMTNAAEAAGGIFEAGTKKGIKWMSDFAEVAQNKFAIPRKEIQAIVAQVSNLGIKIDEKLTGNSKNFKDVTNNSLTAALALDKYLNLASGSSMQNATQLVENYGLTLDKSVDQVLQVGFAAQKSGMNIQKFVGSVHAGAAALVQYQVDAKDVSEVLTAIQKQYKDMGVDPAKAGAMASDITTGLASTFMNMPIVFEIKFGEHLFAKEGKTGMAARNALKDMMINGSPDDKQNTMLEWMVWAKKEVGGVGDKEQQRYALMSQFGMDDNQARTILDFIPEYDGDKIRVDPKKVEEFMKAFETEGETKTLLEKAQYDLVMGLSKVGEGLLKVVTGILGVLIVGFRSLPTLFRALTTVNPVERNALYEKVSAATKAQMNFIGEGLVDMEDGSKMALGAGLDAIYAIAKNIKAAVEADVGGGWTKIGEKMEEMGQTMADILIKQGGLQDAIVEFNQVLPNLVADGLEALFGKNAASDYIKNQSQKELATSNARRENEYEANNPQAGRPSPSKNKSAVSNAQTGSSTSKSTTFVLSDSSVKNLMNNPRP